MTRFDPNPNLVEFDPEIERTLRQIRKSRRRLFDTSFADNSIFHSLVPDSSLDFANNFVFADKMANRTLTELAAPNMNYQALAIQYLELEADFELKSGLIHLLPKFLGLAGEDPHKHLKEFHVVCSTMKPHGVEEDHIKLRAFPFSLDGSAKDWLYYLHPGSITSWQDMKRMFLEKFFLASRAASIKKEICGIRQITGETLHEYWERLKKLCASCPHHQISEQLLIQCFYEGLLPMDRSMVCYLWRSFGR